MNCGCVIEPGCTRHIKNFVEPGVTSQGAPLEDAPESIRFKGGVSTGKIIQAWLYQDSAAQIWRDIDILPVTPAFAGIIWRCYCGPNDCTERVEPNLYQVWLSARRHFFHNHADKGAA